MIWMSTHCGPWKKQCKNLQQRVEQWQGTLIHLCAMHPDLANAFAYSRAVYAGKGGGGRDDDDGAGGGTTGAHTGGGYAAGASAARGATAL